MADKPLQTVWKKALQTKAKPLQAVRTSAYRQFEPCNQFERALQAVWTVLASSLDKPWQAV